VHVCADTFPPKKRVIAVILNLCYPNAVRKITKSFAGCFQICTLSKKKSRPWQRLRIFGWGRGVPGLGKRLLAGPQPLAGLDTPRGWGGVRLKKGPGPSWNIASSLTCIQKFDPVPGPPMSQPPSGRCRRAPRGARWGARDGEAPLGSGWEAARGGRGSPAGTRCRRLRAVWAEGEGHHGLNKKKKKGEGWGDVRRESRDGADGKLVLRRAGIDHSFVNGIRSPSSSSLPPMLLARLGSAKQASGRGAIDNNNNTLCLLMYFA